MRNFLLCSSILFASSFSFSQAHAQCFDILNCQSMGYTKTSCINGGVIFFFKQKSAYDNTV